MLVVAVLSPVVSHLALVTNSGLALAVPIAAAQAVAVGLLLRGAVPVRWRSAALLLPGTLLAALALGASRSAALGLLATAGLSHAMLYAALLGVFATSLAAGRTPMVTGFARRLNPRFRPDMEEYTRAVTVAWCGFFALQMVSSGLLLWLAPGSWQLFVTVLNAPLIGLMMGLEYAVRRRRFAGQPHTSLLDTIRGMRSGAALGRSAEAPLNLPDR